MPALGPVAPRAIAAPAPWISSRIRWGLCSLRARAQSPRPEPAPRAPRPKPRARLGVFGRCGSAHVALFNHGIPRIVTSAAMREVSRALAEVYG